MKITVEDINPTRKALVANVTAEEVNAEEKSVLSEYTRAARLPGFRPGKAPLDMVRRRYTREIDEELQRKVGAKAYEAAVKESKVNIYFVVSVDGGPFAPGKEGTLKFVVDVQPEFNLPEYKGLPVEKESTDVSDADVEAAVLDLRQQRADYIAVERAAAKGDFVRLNYTGTIAGKPIAEIVPDKTIYGTQQGTWEEAAAVESPGVRAVIDGVVGMKAGDKKDVTQVFAADFEVPALAGQTASYALEILEVREKRPAALDEAFFKSFQANSAEQLSDRVREDLKNRRNQQALAGVREQIIKALTGAVDFPLPESAVENETQAILRDYVDRQMQQGVPEAELEKRKEELFSGAKQAAATRVKLTLILLKIAEKESIKVDNEDLHKRIMQESIMTRQRPEQIVKRLQEDRGLLGHLQRSVLQAKSLDFVAAQAKQSTK